MFVKSLAFNGMGATLVAVSTNESRIEGTTSL